jgi:hypothetical protein
MISKDMELAFPAHTDAVQQWFYQNGIFWNP